MPQDIPVEASETLDFTPDCLAGLESPPVFRLRAATTRDKRWMRRLIREGGATAHSTETMRAEMLKALKPLWGDDAYAEHAPVIEAYWQALDDHALQVRDDPDLVFEYDPEIEAACLQLETDAAQAWPPLARMRADNAFTAEISELALVAIVLKGWSGVSLTPVRDRSYLTVDSAEDLKSHLANLDSDAKRTVGTTWMEIFLACSRRLFLDKDEEKNSASPSPSETAPPSSSPGKGATSGKSPAPASSTETPPSE